MSLLNIAHSIFYCVRVIDLISVPIVMPTLPSSLQAFPLSYSTHMSTIGTEKHNCLAGEKKNTLETL